MGVTGLWRLIEPSGTLVPLQSLDNKVLAVDVSIWLHQAIKGFQNASGGTLPNAHLLGIYHRICKLLFFGIKPVVIFDGGVPNLKQQTIFQRANKRSKAISEAETIHNKLVSALLKHTAIGKILSDESKASLTVKPVKEQADNIYELPPANIDTTQSSEEDESSTSVDSSPNKQWALHTFDEKSVHFKALPADVRHDILTDLKETRKQSSWGKLHELPKQSGPFSDFQMKRLLKRYAVQACLEEAEKEMGGRSLSLAELESLLKDQGVVTNDDSVGKRIASDESKRYLLIKDLKKAMDDAKKQQEILNIINEEREEEQTSPVSETAENKSTRKKCDEEFENDLKTAIELSLQDVPSTSRRTNISTHKKLHELSFLQDFSKEDFQASSESDEDGSTNKNLNTVMASAKNYMMEYSGLTPSEIFKIMSEETKSFDKPPTKQLPLISEEYVDTSEIETQENIKKGSAEQILKDKQVEPKNVDAIGRDQESDSSSDSVELKEIEVTNKQEPDTLKLVPNSESNVKTTIEFENVSKVVVDDESDSSDDFVEVDENVNLNKQEAQTTLEIVVKPADIPEDDLFSDIFNDSKSTKKPLAKANKPNLSKIREIINTDTNKQNYEKDVTEVETKAESSIKATLPPISREQLEEMQQDLQLENIELAKEQQAKERMANSLSEQIIQETQDLLRLFGVPYIIAPMEAEAQCAFLELINLTDGTITDDSDIWLFGGKTVYKNFFNQQKHVLEFRAEKIQEHYKLTREQMILLALLVGSDYTMGLQGVGPVTALEILGAFPSPLKQIGTSYNYQQLLSGLIEFRKWLNGERTMGLGRQGLRSKLKNVSINDSFPNLDVVRAYLEPNIDISKEAFSWGKPNIDGLMNYAKRKFGWSQERSKGILKPVLKSLEPEVQKSIKHYFKTKHKIQGADVGDKMSKRVKKAVENLDNEANISEKDKSKDDKKITRRSRKKKVEPESSTCGLSSDEDVQVLQKNIKATEIQLDKIHKEVASQLETVKKVPTTASLHKKEVIPQKQKDKADALRNKMKAIEAFRTSKKGPGFVKSRKHQVRAPKADAGLSESSSD